jgi:hypothetical protein
MAKMAYSVFFILLFAGCANKPQETAIEEIDPYEMPKYYIPNDLREYILKQKKEYLKKYGNRIEDFKYRYVYDNQENGIIQFKITLNNLEEIKFNSGILKSGGISNSTINANLTKKKRDVAEYRIEQRRKDTAFAEIEKLVLQIATEYKYDYEKAFGIPAKYRNENAKKVTCDGFSNAVIQTFENHTLVEKIEKWSSKIGRHAWNVIILKDGRKIYCDVTWYQTQSSATDSEGYIIEFISKTPSMLTFDLEEFNSFGGATDKETGEIIKIHFDWEDAKLEN